MTLLSKRRTVAVTAPAAAALLAVAVFAPWQADAATDASTSTADSGWTLTWSDEFEGSAGDAVDSTKWQNDVGGEGWGNSQLEYDTAGTENAALDGEGNLAITAKADGGDYDCWYGDCTYTSARLNTAGLFTQTYGRLEARMKTPCGEGLWPAFWALGSDISTNPWPANGEIDVMESVGSAPNTVYGTVHGPGYSGSEGISGNTVLSEALCNDYHEYSADWDEDSISFAVDGTTYQTVTADDLGGDEWVFDHEFYLILDLAVGGSWPGSPTADTAFPATLSVDYVRVYEASGETTEPTSTESSGDVTGATGEITGLGGNCLDVDAANDADGTQVQIYPCNDTVAQEWTMASDGTVRALGKCLDVDSAGTADGTKIQLYTCNGTVAQQWVYSSAGDIVNPNADKCLDVTGSSTSEKTPVQLYTCSGGSNQKWTVPTASA